MTRLAIAVCCYAVIFAASLFCALLLRFDFVLTEYAMGVFRDSVLILVLLKIAVVLFSRDWRRRMRYSTIYDLAWSAGICLVCGILISALQIAHETMPQIPRSVIAMDTLISAGAIASARIMAQTLRTLGNTKRSFNASRTLVYAYGSEAAAMTTSIQSSSRKLRVVGIVSPRNLLPNSVIAGVPVYDASQGLESIIRQTRAEVLLMPSRLSGREVREVSEVCLKQGVNAHLVPSVDEIPSGRFELKMREVTIDDLLRREPNQLDMAGICTFLGNRVVMVTGASGSIGSEVCRQLLNFGPRKIILLDQSEFGIFQLEQEFLGLQKDRARILPQLEFIVEDITDKEAMTRIFMLHRPAVVFHAAAYKHVPLMESNPQAAVRNNVFGTQVLVDVADRFSVERFVMISTDKAVRPTNVMGATKLIAEQYLHTVATHSKTRFITVRFGNVLNSAGSVVPTFRRQIEEGGPVTVTDPEMLRYFMTIPEAVQLVLQSGAVGEGGDVLILDMGEPVRIVDLAKDMIRLSGQRYPDDIDIVFTGLRPGEKLYEELFYETEQNAVRIHEKIFRAPRESENISTMMKEELRQLTEHLNSSREELREVLWQVTSRIVQRSSAQPVPIEQPRRGAA
ncbi:MAG: nucleoside-diphosphate sugar epimerase/dehydratase [Planctomycetaceae bacterium]